VKSLRYTLEWAAVETLAWLARLVPRSMIHRVGTRFGRFVYPLFTSRRRVAMRNLRNAYPDLPAAELERMAMRSFGHMSAAFVELLATSGFSADDIRWLVRVDNSELIDELLARKKSVVVLTAHYGNWELAAQAAVLATRAPASIIFKRQSNPRVDALIGGWRARFGGTLVPMQGVREVLRSLQAGRILILAADQAASTESPSVEFFGRMVPTFTGPALFALRSGAALVIGLAVAQEDGTYRMRFREVPTDDLADASESNVLELTRRHVRMTEEIIREHPEQWMWTHKRWKHVPDRPEVRATTEP
jgi:KDO2-lipid IV(A) lauroyltransferase